MHCNSIDEVNVIFFYLNGGPFSFDLFFIGLTSFFEVEVKVSKL